MDIGRAIRLCRTQRGLSQGQLAEKASCSTACINQLEKGKRDPTSTITNIANALGIPVGLLFFLGAEQEDLHGLDKTLQGDIARTILTLIKGGSHDHDEAQSA